MTAAPAPTANPAAAQQPAEAARARVAIMVARHQVDVAVPTKFSVETFIDDLLTVLAKAIDDDSVDFVPGTGQWTLARPGSPPIPRWRTLADHDIADGAVLMLTTVESSEIFTPVVEDITDALAHLNEREFAEFDATTATSAGLTALVLGGLTVAVLLSWSWTESASVSWCAVPAAALGLMCWIAATVAGRRGSAPAVGLSLGLAALPLISAGTAMAVPPAYGQPGGFAAANLCAGAAVAAVVTAAQLRSIRSGTAVLIAATALGALVAAAAGCVAYLDVSIAQVAAGAILVALILLTVAPRMAVVAAHIRPPDLPDPGRELGPGTLTDIFDAESAPADGGGDGPDATTEQPGDRPAAGLETRARLAVTTLRGLFLAESSVLSGATLLTVVAGAGGIRENVLAAAVSGVLAMRARWHPDRMQAVTLIAAAAVTTVGTGFVLVGVYVGAPARTVVALVLAAAALAACLAGGRLPGARLSPVARRVIDLVEFTLILVVPILACWIMGIYTAMRTL